MGVARAIVPSLKKPAMRAPRINFDKKIDLLCGLCQMKKPEHRKKEPIAHPQTGSLVDFFPGKFLNCLIDHVVPNKHSGHVKPLTDEQRTKLYSLIWFEDWRQGILDVRSVGPDGREPDLDEKVELLLKTYVNDHGLFTSNKKKPVWNECLGNRNVVRNNGLTYTLSGFRLMEKLSSNWFADSKRGAVLTPLQKAAVEVLPWFAQWRADGEQRRAVAAMRKVVTKDQKIALLAEHYSWNDDGTPRGRPNWSDSIPVAHTAVRDGKGNVVSVWEFKPATFLDDLVDNWVEGGRPGVTLTAEQKEGLEKLPWVKDWIRSVLTSRERKRVLQRDSDIEDPSTPTSKCSKSSLSGSPGS